MDAISSRTDGRTKVSIQRKKYAQVMDLMRWGEKKVRSFVPYEIGYRVLLPDGSTGRISLRQHSMYTLELYYYMVNGLNYEHQELRLLEVVIPIRRVEMPLPFEDLDVVQSDWNPPGFGEPDVMVWAVAA